MRKKLGPSDCGRMLMHQGWSLLQQRLVTQVHHIRPRPEVVRNPGYVVAQLESLLAHPSLAKSAVV